MRKAVMLAALTGAFATAAHAQTSVTLYGLIDAGITYTNNQGGHSNVQETDGAINTSRWGLRGSEDLGGGLKAIFTLENGFNVSTGALRQNGRLFGRQAFVGLSDNQYGSVTLGRQYDSVVDYLGPLALTGTQYGGTYFAHPFDNDNLDNDFRIDNSIKYQSANYNGLKFEGLYGFSNEAGEFSNNRAYSFGASYNYLGLTVAAGYLQINNDVTSAVITNTNGVLDGDNTFFAGRQRTWGAGVKCVFGPATAGFVFTQTMLNQAFGISASQSGVTGGLALNGGSARFNNYEINGVYYITPAITLAGNYTYTDGSLNGADPKWNQVDIQAAYLLSKRTELYVQGEYQHVIESGLNIGAMINGLSEASANNNQVAVTAGIRHTF